MRLGKPTMKSNYLILFFYIRKVVSNQRTESVGDDHVKMLMTIATIYDEHFACR